MPQYASRPFGGGEITYFEWEPPPEVLADALMAVSNYVDEVGLPLAASRQIGIDDMRDHFLDEVDPDGRDWAELNEEYAAEKVMEGFPAAILYRTGELFRGATSEDAWQVLGDTLVFNATDLPDYAMYHEYGTSKMPARPYIGLSNKAEAAVYEVFDRWFSRSEEIWINPATGVAQTRVSGRFGPKITPSFVEEF